MSLNSVPSGERIQIGFFGKRNAGKSSLVNAITGQELAVVSDVLGTTTDPVVKAMEILPLGPVVIIDTPGFDDEGRLGKKRIEKTVEILKRVDVAVLVVDKTQGMSTYDEELISIFKDREIPYIIAYNKSDLYENQVKETDDSKKMDSKNNESDNKQIIDVSAYTRDGIRELKEMIGHLFKQKVVIPLVEDLVEKGDTVILVIPIDSSAPKGRIILPQQQVLRGVLDKEGVAICVQPEQLVSTIENLKTKPKMVITDSQAFFKVKDMVSEDIYLTSFSILMARHKGILDMAVEGVKAIDTLEDGDTVLISEGCTHHRQCEDIGTVKLPNLLKKYTGKDIKFETSSGNTFAKDLSKYKMVIHCGGCMLGDREVRSRMKMANEENTPMTNYGIAISYMRGILERSIEVLGIK
ncbi:MAG TPA: [FeFe] hydrogenase H-cluster maturation GTPase HydF [Eubacterium sp.]|nr:[FeFe] hydrogenase H-cluster maturation GTPase HydF [Eubacterium sp.]